MFNLSVRKKRLWFACLLWGALLVVLALEPIGVVKIFFPNSASRSFAHVLFYGILGFLLCLYWRFKRHLGKSLLKNVDVVILSFLLTAALGGMTEIMQLWTLDRMADWNDWGFDMLGAVIGISCFYLFRRAL